nr:MAG: hypothetical protein [Gammatorquevirus sp.]
MHRNTKEKEKDHSTTQKPQRREPGNPNMSPLALRRKYMPRPASKPPAAHPAPTAAARKTQAQHHSPPHRPQEKAKIDATPNRFRVEPFKDGFEKETEKELAIAFCRPPRMYKNDPPFYPWLPICPKVQFNLNFKG